MPAPKVENIMARTPAVKASVIARAGLNPFFDPVKWSMRKRRKEIKESHERIKEK